MGVVNVNLAIGLLLAFAVGAVCRRLDIPVPAPPSVYGVLLILAITLGYLTVDRFFAR